MLEIDITEEKGRFKNHLGLYENNQIIFSGIFGIGKTYFLEKFFNENRNYDTFFLSPVNYSISQNEDIIDYIKYDIAFEILTRDIEFDKIDFSTSITLPFFIENFNIDIVVELTKNWGKVGKTISSVIEIAKKHREFNEESNIDEQESIINFLKEIKETKGSIFEENLITEILARLIEQLKSKDKEVILIIDDLDRIDPEHIFRILNVLLAILILEIKMKTNLVFKK